MVVSSSPVLERSREHLRMTDMTVISFLPNRLY